MTLKQLHNLILSDLPGYDMSFWRAYMIVPGFKYTVNQRVCYFLSTKSWLKPIWLIQWLRLKHLTYKFGIQMSWMFNLPRNFVIAHFGGITFFPKECGENIYLRQGVTVGASHTKGPRATGPILGSNITFGANSIVVGPIKVGNNVIIGAGAVVINDVPDNCVVAGVPAKIVKQLTESE